MRARGGGQRAGAATAPGPAQSDSSSSDSDEEYDMTENMTTEAIKELTAAMDEHVITMKWSEAAVRAKIKETRLRTKENNDTVAHSSALPHTVATVAEVFDDGYALKTSNRLNVFVEGSGLAHPEYLKPGTLVGVHPTSFTILSVLAGEYDQRALAMMVEKKPTEQWNDVGGLDKQISELKEAVVLPITHKEMYAAIGITPPRGVLLYGAPGTGKTMLARTVAAQCNAAFVRLAAPQLAQQFIGDGAKIVRDAFKMARDNAPAIVFIDELDAIGTKRSDSVYAGGREVHRTLLELLNQLDGFRPDDTVKVIAATNRVDVLDPALLRSGRLDKKIELPVPDEDGRQRIMRIHASGMRVHPDVNYAEVSRCMDGFNGAQCRAVTVEAAMTALRRDATVVGHEDFMDAVAEVSARQKLIKNAAMFT